MISYYLPSGSKIGVGYQVHELATELVRRGHQVDVFSDCPPVEGAVYGHHHVHLSGSLRTFRFATQLRKVDLRGTTSCTPTATTTGCGGGGYRCTCAPSTARASRRH